MVEAEQDDRKIAEEGAFRRVFRSRCQPRDLATTQSLLVRRLRLDEQTILANDPEFGNVTVCPGGLVHVNLVHVSLKFGPSDFVRLCELMGKARLNFEGRQRPKDGKPRLQLVPCETDEEPSTDPKE